MNTGHSQKTVVWQNVLQNKKLQKVESLQGKRKKGYNIKGVGKNATRRIK